jgi:hypothetical protein
MWYRGLLMSIFRNAQFKEPTSQRNWADSPFDPATVLISSVGSTAVAWTLPARAATRDAGGRIPVRRTRQPLRQQIAAFLEGLKESGYAEGQNMAVCARLLGVEPARTVVIEDAISGVEAGLNRNFGLVIGVAGKGMPRSSSDMARIWWSTIWANWSTDQRLALHWEKRPDAAS